MGHRERRHYALTHIDPRGTVGGIKARKKKHRIERAYQLSRAYGITF
jgi:hypothetical protein